MRLNLLLFIRKRDEMGKHIKDLGPVSQKSRKIFGPEKPFVKLRPAYSVKMVFSELQRE